MSEYGCDYCGTEVLNGNACYNDLGDRLCSDCFAGVTTVTDPVVWADDLWDSAIAALNDLVDFYSIAAHQPGAPAARSGWGSIRQRWPMRACRGRRTSPRCASPGRATWTTSA